MPAKTIRSEEISAKPEALKEAILDNMAHYENVIRGNNSANALTKAIEVKQSRIEELKKRRAECHAIVEACEDALRSTSQIRKTMALILVSTENISHKEWLAYRNLGIGGSDVSVVCGINRWKSPIELWMEKTGQFPHQEAGEAAYWGNRLEDLVKEEFTMRTGIEVIPVSAILQHEEYPFMLAKMTNKTQTSTKTITCILITILLLFSMLPTPTWANETEPQIQRITIITDTHQHSAEAVIIDDNVFVYLQFVHRLFDRYIPFDDVANIWFDYIPKVCILSVSNLFGYSTTFTGGISPSVTIDRPIPVPTPTPSPTPVPTPRPSPTPTPRVTAPRTRQRQQIVAGVSNFVDERFELQSIIQLLSGETRWNYWGQVPTTTYQQLLDRHFRPHRNHPVVDLYRQHGYWWIFYNITRIGDEFVFFDDFRPSRTDITFLEHLNDFYTVSNFRRFFNGNVNFFIQETEWFINEIYSDFNLDWWADRGVNLDIVNIVLCVARNSARASQIPETAKYALLGVAARYLDDTSYWTTLTLSHEFGHLADFAVSGNLSHNLYAENAEFRRIIADLRRSYEHWGAMYNLWAARELVADAFAFWYWEENTEYTLDELFHVHAHHWHPERHIRAVLDIIRD